MKAFDLQAALNGAPVVTVSGEPVTCLHRFDGVTDGQNVLFGVVGGAIEDWGDDGRQYRRFDSQLDLCMVEDQS